MDHLVYRYNNNYRNQNRLSLWVLADLVLKQRFGILNLFGQKISVSWMPERYHHDDFLVVPQFCFPTGITISYNLKYVNEEMWLKFFTETSKLKQKTSNSIEMYILIIQSFQQLNVIINKSYCSLFQGSFLH